MIATATRGRPIIMGAESVRAILNGTKTQTRRVLKVQPPESTVRLDPWLDPVNGWMQYERGRPLWASTEADGTRRRYGCPYGEPGDRLWVRESYYEVTGEISLRDAQFLGWGTHFYAADFAGKRTYLDKQWRSPIFMPRRLSRLTLTITDVRAERLQDITEADARAEGMILGAGDEYLTETYREAWNALNAKRGYPWSSNPWVWVVSFEVTK